MLDSRIVGLRDTVRSFKEILSCQHDSLPESAFYMAGTIEGVISKAEQLALSPYRHHLSHAPSLPAAAAPTWLHK
ncbi:hypothetical protein EDB84DRAFT_694854 [Lactarius hengduanensis]|nr:hypothetical protein EDB84DRAFT_694854 [Lactarius hengduanensis]